MTFLLVWLVLGGIIFLLNTYIDEDLYKNHGFTTVDSLALIGFVVILFWPFFIISWHKKPFKFWWWK